MSIFEVALIELTLVGRLENVIFENEKQTACACPTLAIIAQGGLWQEVKVL